ncbi:dihydroorotate dehydrogenase-like protein [bacterium]|nr:dihydroorotate dehydrogenase-like protein [bacterium]MBU1985363.1 dihydroorotate dehydrogenase-like protein [bacterium]
MDLSTTYLGLKLAHPLVASSSPLSYTLDGIRRLEDAGLAAVVLHSLFEEQLKAEAYELDFLTTQGTESFAEALSYFPQPDHFVLGPEEYLKLISDAKKAVKIPIIASLNGVTPGGWIEYAREIQKAGADALELNVYFLPTDPFMTGEIVERNYVEILKTVRSQVKIPVAVKLSPYFSSLANVARRLDEAGANALVLFNRFYQPDLDLENLEVAPNVELSSSAEIRLPLRWIAILHGRVKCNLAATTGIHTAEDVIKVTMAGADVAMLCSAIFQNGPESVKRIRKEVADWMEQREYRSLAQMKGSMSQKSVAEPAAYERANYMKTIQSFRPVI